MVESQIGKLFLGSLENTHTATLSEKNIVFGIDFVIGLCLKSSTRCVVSVFVPVKYREL